MSILITGCAGFLGSHIALKYLMSGENVIGIDDFCTSLGREAPHVNALKQFTNFHLWEHDMSKETSSSGLNGQGMKIDVIFNMACPASPPKYQAMPVHTLMTCVNGAKNVLDLARELGSTVVHASTSEIYGDPQHNPQVESDWGNVNSYGPRSCYDEGKRAAEALMYDYGHKYGVDVKIVRIFNTYGPCMDPDDGRVVTNFIKQFLTDNDVTIYGTGKQTRSFCYVSDLVDGITRMAMSDKSFTGPVNLGNPNEFTMIELAEKIKELIPESKSNIVHCALPIDDPHQRKPDISLAKRSLGWEPKIQLSEGLIRTIDYMKTVRQYFNRSWLPCHKM